MRTIRMIDVELRVLAVYRSACAADGYPVRSTAVVDRLLDERQRTAGRPASGLPSNGKTAPDRSRGRRASQ
jgi:hypothetical protein